MTLLADAPAVPRPVTATEVADAELDGVWVVDVRAETGPRSDPAEGPTEPSHVGWLVPWEDDIVLLSGSPDVLSPRSGSRWR